MNIAAYCRVSTDKSDQLNSLEAQKNFFTEFAEKNGHALARLYADEGISGTRIKNRKEFQRLMRDARYGLFQMVVVKDISRFARNTVDFLQSIRWLKALGIETVFLTANMTALGNSEFVLTIFGALAQEESANTSKRIKFGKRINAEKGRVPNIVYGYDKTVGDYFNLRINDWESRTVRQIFDWYTKEGYGASRIAGMLNEQGHRTKRGCMWSQNAICRILANELYTGLVINGKQEVADFLTGARADRDETHWIVVEKPELRIIEPEQFESARKIMGGRWEKFSMAKERQSNKYLFSTLIKCKECGYSFRRMVRTYKKTYVRWVCGGHNGKGVDSCPNGVAVDEEALINAIDGYFCKILKDKKKTMKSIRSELERAYGAQDHNREYENKLQAGLNRLLRLRQKYMDMYADDIISREELTEKVAGMRDEISGIENELKLVQYNLGKDDMLESVMGRIFSNMEDVASAGDMSNRQLKQAIQRIQVDKDGNIDVYLRLLDDPGLSENVPICDVHT